MLPRTVVQLLIKPQMSERRSNTICAVVERPDHHCGDDLASKHPASRRPYYNRLLSYDHVCSVAAVRAYKNGLQAKSQPELNHFPLT